MQVNSVFFQRRVRILVVDNDPSARVLTQSLLLNWDYEPVLAMGAGHKLVADAERKAREKHCALAIIDMRLFDDSDTEDDSGLKFADELRKIIPCIILSGYGGQEILVKMIQKYKDLYFIPKNTPPESIREQIDAVAIKVSAAKRGLNFESLEFMEDIADSELGSLTKDYPDQVTDILAKLFPTATTLKVEKLNTRSLELNIVTAPRPASIILNVYQEERYEPTIVKIARHEKIKKEVERYNKYIPGKVTERFTGRLDRSEILWNVGGAAYSYPGDNNVIPFSRFYEERSVSDIEDCLKFFFDSIWYRHYLNKYDRGNLSLYGLYTQVWGNWFAKTLRAFPDTKPLDIGFATKELGTPEPIQWVKKNIIDNPYDISIVKNTRIAVTHGDLHGDNLLVDSNKIALVVDFERCGEGHALQDFVELETDIITRLRTHSLSPFEYFNMFLFIIEHRNIHAFDDLEGFNGSDNRHIKKALRIISLLRSLSFQHTGISDAREYILGLLFNVIFRAAISYYRHPEKGQHQALILASIICHRLDHWDEPWPPTEWKVHFK